jgi:guanylate kinase
MVKSIIFSAPSGSGKTTIVKHILKTFPQIKFSISATTRNIRPGEEDGKDYYFLSPQWFKHMIELDEFVEWEEVYKDQYYGTLKSEVKRIWDDGGIVIYDMDVIGGVNLKKKFGDESTSFFVKVPTIEELEKRLRDRGTETEDKIKMRISKAQKEMEYETHFDKIIINTDLETTLNEVEEIIKKLI